MTLIQQYVKIPNSEDILMVELIKSEADDDSGAVEFKCMVYYDNPIDNIELLVFIAFCEKTAKSLFYNYVAYLSGD